MVSHLFCKRELANQRTIPTLGLVKEKVKSGKVVFHPIKEKRSIQKNMLWAPGRGCTGGGNLQSCRQEAWKYNVLILCIKDYRMGVYDVYLCKFSKIQFYLRLLLITARAQMFRLPSWFRWTEAKARP